MPDGIKLSEYITASADRPHSCQIDAYDLSEDDILFNYCTPPLGAEGYFPSLFGKYGHTASNVYGDFWKWDEEALQKATELEKWKMIGLSAIHCEHYYRKSLEKIYKCGKPANAIGIMPLSKREDRNESV